MSLMNGFRIIHAPQGNLPDPTVYPKIVGEVTL